MREDPRKGLRKNEDWLRQVDIREEQKSKMLQDKFDNNTLETGQAELVDLRLQRSRIEIATKPGESPRDIEKRSWKG
jgi:hypothetical protein